MGAKKTDEFYSLMNVTNGNILSAKLNGVYYYHQSKDKVHTRKRNWKLSQFQIDDFDLLDYFVNGEKIDIDARWSMGVHEIWVKEEDLDELYAVLAISTLRNFCGRYNHDKQKSLLGAFLFHKDPKLFLEKEWTGTRNSPVALLKELKAGKEFLEFLESFGVLSFAKQGNKYVNGKWVTLDGSRHFFSVAELEVVKRQRKDIITTYEHRIPS